MRAVVFLFFALRASAAVLQGVVLDDDTGYPLARTSVTLAPLPGTDASALTIRTGDRGAFSILNVRPGWYILKTSRRGYADTEAGQLRPGRPGVPFEVLPDAQSTFLQLRMKRMAAITGILLDENNVGMPEMPVHIYSARKPVRRLAEGKTDDRGVFRIAGLDTGTYIVRSGASLPDDDSVVPTYYKYGGSVDNAERIRVRVGETQQDVAIHPQKGRLFAVSGILTAQPFIPIRLTLITDTGRRVVISAPGPFEAVGIPPGPIELLVEGGPGPDGVPCGSYTKLVLDRDIGSMRIGCAPLYRPVVDWRVRESPKPGLQYPILARRVDLDGASETKTFRTDDFILPGHYELMVQTGAQHYARGMTGSFQRQPVLENGWFGVDFASYPRLTVLLSDMPSSAGGVVTTAGKPVAGAVVYLESFDPTLTDPRLQLWSARTDKSGKYTFSGLTPGRYRLLSTFDFDPEDPFAMNTAREVTLRDGETGVLDLELGLRQ